MAAQTFRFEVLKPVFSWLWFILFHSLVLLDAVFSNKTFFSRSFFDYRVLHIFVRALVSGSNAWRESLDRKRNASKMAILTKKSKIFIKAKVIFMKSCLLGHVGFMIWCILNNFIFSNAIYRKVQSAMKKCMAWALSKRFSSI